MKIPFRQAKIPDASGRSQAHTQAPTHPLPYSHTLSRTHSRTSYRFFSAWLLCLPFALALSGGCVSGGRNPTPRAYPSPKASGVRHAAPSRLVLPDVLPRVMIMVDEQSLGTVATSEVEAMAARKLVALGVPVVDQDMVRANIARTQQMLKAAGDNRGAASIGAQFGADVVLVGEAVAKPSARRIADSNLRSYQAVVTLRAVRTDNASTLASASEDATQVGLEDVSGSAKALRAAADTTLDRILPGMLSGWTPSRDAAPGGFHHPVELTFGGVDQIWKVRAIRESLRARTGDLQSVVQRGYSPGLAEFSVASRLPAEELAEELVLAPPEGLRMQVLNINRGKIQFRAVEN